MSSEGITNPLSKHFRQPALHFRLPSRGRHWPEGSLDLPVTGELPVFPMTTKDEIILKTPDALMNGSSIVSVIESCCPNIKDAWRCPAVDIDAILVAIRIASYGETMDINCTCPKCSDNSDYEVSLPNTLASIQAADYSKPVEVAGLSIRLKPQTYRDIERAAQIRFEEQQVLKTLSADGLPNDEKAQLFDHHLEKFVDLNIESLVASTDSVTTEDGVVVTNHEFIAEFYKNCDSKIIKKVNTTLMELLTNRDFQKQKITCPACGNNYETTVEFNASNFFA